MSSASQPASSTEEPSDIRPAVFGNSAFTKVEQNKIQRQLAQKLGSDFTVQRQGAGGSKVHYLEGWRSIAIANRIFGYNGWSSSINELTPDFIDGPDERGRYSVGVTAVVRVELRDGTFHEDIGYGTSEGMKSKGDSIQNAKKSAVTDANKRALRFFGDILGNCLYDKQHIRGFRRGQYKVTQISSDSCDSNLQQQQQNAEMERKKQRLREIQKERQMKSQGNNNTNFNNTNNNHTNYNNTNVNHTNCNNYNNMNDNRNDTKSQNIVKTNNTAFKKPFTENRNKNNHNNVKENSYNYDNNINNKVAQNQSTSRVVVGETLLKSIPNQKSNDQVNNIEENELDEFENFENSGFSQFDDDTLASIDLNGDVNGDMTIGTNRHKDEQTKSTMKTIENQKDGSKLKRRDDHNNNQHNISSLPKRQKIV